MKKSELLELGVPQESIREIMKLNGESLEKLKKKLNTNKRSTDEYKARDAIISIVHLLKKQSSLDKVLHTATAMYHIETQEKVRKEEEKTQTAQEEAQEKIQTEENEQEDLK